MVKEAQEFGPVYTMCKVVIKPVILAIKVRKTSFKIFLHAYLELPLGYCGKEAIS